MDKSIDRLIQFMDGDLSEAEAAAVQSALDADEAFQAEHLALKRIDRLLTEAPMATPSINFAEQFEAKLDQRLNRQRNIWGGSIIALILIFSAALMAWSVLTSGISPFVLADSNVIIGNIIDALQSTFAQLSVILRVTALTTSTMVKVTLQPTFWILCSLAAGMVVLWVQLVKRIGINQGPVTA
ncbi:MAG: hypothetical protein AAF629_22860 [Chloroflexota bacterium]